MNIWEDVQGFFSGAHNYVVNDRAKHDFIKYKLVIGRVQEGNITIAYTPNKQINAHIIKKNFCTTDSLSNFHVGYECLTINIPGRGGVFYYCNI